MIATPEQYRTLADLIERADVFGTIMVGADMFVAMGTCEVGPLVRVYKDGTFDNANFVDDAVRPK